jgi:transcriptional regulator with XRE-family HTH domain
MGIYGRGVASLTSVIGPRIRGLRAERRMRQADLAERLGLAARTVGYVEAGERALIVDELPAVCRALGVDLRTLFAGADPADLEALGLR